MIARKLAVFALLMVPVCGFAAPLPLAPGKPADLRGTPLTTEPTRFTVAGDTQIPGKVLAAGTYSIRIVDHLTDRMIVRLSGPDGVQTNFLALPKSVLSTRSKGPILVKAEATGQVAMRGFTFADGTVAEFVYPKGEAVSLAKTNGSTFPAIDPESEGRAPAASLSKDDMDMVTLWMLTPTNVGPGDPGPGVKAAKYQVGPTDAPVRRPKPLMAALPHTASDGPLMLLVGGLLVTAGAAMTGRRRIIARS